MTLPRVSADERVRSAQISFKTQYDGLNALKIEWLRPGRDEVALGSALHASDELIGGFFPPAADSDYRIATKASSAIRAALERACFAGFLILRAKEWPPYAVFAFIRGAIEAAAEGVWVLAPDDPDVRIHRHFSLLMAEVEDRERNTHKRSEHRPAYALEKRREDEEAAERGNTIRSAAAGCGVVMALHRPVTAEMVNSASQAASGRLPTLRLWRTCTALSHPRPWSISRFDLSMWAAEHIGHISTREAAAEELMRDGMNGAITLIDDLIWRYDERAGRAHVWRPS